MSTPQYGTRVLAKNGRSLTLQVFSISEDTPAPPDARDLDLFVRLLCDEDPLLENPGKKGKAVALSGRIASDGGDLFDEDWLWDNAARYVTQVVEQERKNEDAEPRFSSWQAKKRAFKNETRLAQAVFELELSDPVFASHLEVGDGWDSCAHGCERWADGQGNDEDGEDDCGDDDEVGGEGEKRESIELIAVEHANPEDDEYAEVNGLPQKLQSLRGTSRTPAPQDVIAVAHELGGSAKPLAGGLSDLRELELAMAGGPKLRVEYTLDVPESVWGKSERSQRKALDELFARGAVSESVTIHGDEQSARRFVEQLAKRTGPLIVSGREPMIYGAPS